VFYFQAWSNFEHLCIKVSVPLLKNMSEDKHGDNIGVLKDFVEDNDLQNRFSIIRFYCVVSIVTVQNAVTISCEAMITFDTFRDEGVLSLMESGLDPYLYPTNFKAKYDDFSIVKNRLVIYGNHTKNHNIGKYEIKVQAKGKVKG
jgi:hypothetical protein